MSELSVSTPVSGDHATLARRYSGALYDLAAEQNAVDIVAGDMRGLRRLWQESAEWRTIACDPRLDVATVAKAVQQVARLSGISDLTVRFLNLVTQKRRLSLLPGMVEAFLQKVDAHRGEYRADIRVAHAMSGAQREALAATLNAVVGGKVHMAVVEDASILGGMTVKIGCQFIDASVKTRLDHLERSLKGAA